MQSVFGAGNHAERIDHRSYERQGIDQIRTIHLGAAASQMEKHGIRTERRNINREIEISNQKLRQLKARIVKLQNWVKEESANTEPPTLADVIERILMRRQQSGKASIYSLKAAANMLNFLTANGIMYMAGLDGKLKTMVDKQFSSRDKLKSTEQRLKTLDEHIRQSKKRAALEQSARRRKHLIPQTNTTTPTAPGLCFLKLPSGI